MLATTCLFSCGERQQLTLCKCDFVNTAALFVSVPEGSMKELRKSLRQGPQSLSYQVEVFESRYNTVTNILDKLLVTTKASPSSLSCDPDPTIKVRSGLSFNHKLKSWKDLESRLKSWSGMDYRSINICTLKSW